MERQWPSSDTDWTTSRRSATVSRDLKAMSGSPATPCNFLDEWSPPKDGHEWRRETKTPAACKHYVNQKYINSLIITALSVQIHPVDSVAPSALRKKFLHLATASHLISQKSINSLIISTSSPKYHETASWRGLNLDRDATLWRVTLDTLYEAAVPFRHGPVLQCGSEVAPASCVVHTHWVFLKTTHGDVREGEDEARKTRPEIIFAISRISSLR